MRLPVFTAALAATLWMGSAQAGLFDRKPADAALDAERAGLQAASVWIDVNWGFRNQGAANALNRSHQAFAARGYRVLSVQPYVENGDLQGFFVTYQKP